MSRRSRTVLCCVVLLGIAAAASAFLITRASPERPPATQSTVQLRATKQGPRNLFLQPEAVAVARKLGKRFGVSSRSSSVIAGSVTIAGIDQPLTITRRQNETGEQVSLLVGGRNLTWDDQEGTKSVAGLLSDPDRLLMERLTLDSPDQFVLAQLRGASYFTIARNVRPTDATDNYTGPLWNLVRVDEPQETEKTRPLSSWRIYYVNGQTGLPDRVEYQLNELPITVEFLEWTKQGEETTPSRVKWSSNGQALMELHVTSVSLNQQ
jgi:hypothetical protein